MEGLDGKILRRADGGYESARRAAVWNARTPERHPEAIVLAGSEDDVVDAVLLAREEGLRVTLRSGGHSWAGNHLRDGGLLIDVSRLNEATVDAEAMTAGAQPGCKGNELAGLLGEHDLFFPAGHCPGVAIGGYLLQGGFGWNGRVHGPACQSVEAIEVVTAAGEKVRADERENAELFWAARGSGPGFFGAVTRFHLRLYPKPPVVANGLYLYPLELLEEVFTWAAEIGPKVSRKMELMLVIHRDAGGEVEIAVTGPVLAESEEEADEALAILKTCPVADKAKAAAPSARVRLADLYAAVHESYPDEHRYSADNMWTHAPVEELLPGLRRIAETLPEAPSHMLWMNWGPSPDRPEMAYSVEDETYIAMYGVWRDPSRDAANVAWVSDHMSEMAHLSTGIQLADENLGNRPARFLSDENLDRLDRVRAEYDPDGLFYGWMGSPPAAAGG